MSAIQTHCDKIDSLAAATNAMVAAMNRRMERDAETIRVLREENDRLRAVVASLPRTADGEPITPSRMLYHPNHDREGYWHTEKNLAGFYYGGGDWEFEPMTECYSSREAMEAATKA